MSRWIDEVMNFASPDVTIIVVGNKKDLVSQRQVKPIPGNSIRLRVNNQVKEVAVIEASAKNDDGALKPGSFARAQIALGGSERHAIVVPRAAVGTTGSASRVFVRAGARVIERIVNIGREVDGNVEIRGTLTANDEVAVTEVDKLSDGAEIKLAP